MNSNSLKKKFSRVLGFTVFVLSLGALSTLTFTSIDLAEVSAIDPPDVGDVINCASEVVNHCSGCNEEEKEECEVIVITKCCAHPNGDCPEGDESDDPRHELERQDFRRNTRAPTVSQDALR